MARILIADDSSIMRRNLKQILTGAGHEVVGEAANGKQAVLHYIGFKPDLVTMDITMPMLDGIEATKQIISKFPEAKIIMISALDQKRKVFEALSNGAKHYIIKPITKEKVLNIVDEVLIMEGIRSSKSKQTKNEEEILTAEKIQSSDTITSEPFVINNHQGMFEIVFNRKIDENIINSLTMAIKGLLFIKPLHVVFDFNQLDELNPSVLNKLDDIAQSIADVGGEVTTSCDKDDLLYLARQHSKTLFQ